ncbi:hypothetical protein FDG2_3374 [Candidatus Protofrankia californiensis]|uniref:Uncharacterized protein n=1 Tax=Candidatus Protofrankia californiensis TaxID=1839754 RepID=A0A1C3NZI0_9ACTN|nr:hypothetical protein [Protofrankia symbiont of Coriaria ruscifolia]SBW22969.1 hypothetical protein FDG2_3374 [Candidatus Protofrankia californiensis]
MDEDEDEGADRDVDEEDPPPPESADDHAAEYRAENRGELAGDGHQAHHPAEP